MTVTSRPSAECTVTGRTGVGGGVMASMSLASTTAVEGPQPAAGSVAVPEATGPFAGDTPGVAGRPLATGLGAAGLGAPPVNVMGTNTSWDRSSVRVWSLRVTTAHATTRQSMVSLRAACDPETHRKLPPGP